MSATPDVKEDQLDAPQRRGDPLNEVGGHPDPEAEVEGAEAEEAEGSEPEATTETDQPDVSAGEEAPLTFSETEGDSASELGDDPEPDEAGERFVREIPGGAGHGPARAYGYIAVATALGAEAELTEGGTRSTSRNPLKITVRADPETFRRVNDLYDEIAPVAEQAAAVKRDEARKSGRPLKSYEMSLLSRAVLAGFPQGAASALRAPGTTRPAPLREATRARFVDESAHRSAVALGRAWASRALAQREEAHTAA